MQSSSIPIPHLICTPVDFQFTFIVNNQFFVVRNSGDRNGLIAGADEPF